MIELGGIKLHAYGLLIGLGVYVAWEIGRKFGKIEEKLLDKLIFGLVLSGVIGARIYHVIDLWEYYSKNISKIFFLWNGGLGIWGALVGGGIYLAIFCYFNKLNFRKILDSIVIGVPFAQAIGRLGNWVNGELIGKHGEPLFVYEAILNIILGLILIYIYGFRVGSRNDRLSTGGVYLIGYGLIRVCLENFRPDSVIWRIYGVPTAIIFGGISIVLGIFLMQKSRHEGRLENY